MKQFSPTAKYHALLFQKGDGCDYTIGCGLGLFILEATTMEDAEEEVRDLVDESILHAWVLTTAEMQTMPIIEWWAEDQEYAREEEEARIEAEELALLAKLKAKHEKT